MRALDRIYRASPLWAQHAGVTVFGAYWRWQRFGPHFSRLVEEYGKRESLDVEAWRRFQREKLSELLHAAAHHVPHYRRVWSRSEKQAAADGRLEDLPLLGKDPLRADPESFLREDMSVGRPFRSHTSGTTGTPILSIRTVSELRHAMALREARSARWAGVSFREPRATFSGRIVEPDPNSRGPFYRYNAAERQVYLSAFHLRPDTAPLYAEALRRHGVVWLTGYAVSSYLLARLLEERGMPAPPLRAVVTTSEKVTPEMRRVMERGFGCRVFEEYSNVENVFFASECEEGRLHVSPEAGLVEIVRPDGSSCPPGETGEVVATGLTRTYQSLIRYRVGDLAQWDAEACPCGRAMPIIQEVVGRVEDVVTGPDGRQMVRFHGIFVDQPHVREGQVCQETLTRFRVRVVPVNGFGPSDVAEIIGRMRQRLGPEVEVIVETVTEIPRTAAGKFRAVVSLLGTEASQTVPDFSPARPVKPGEVPDR